MTVAKLRNGMKKGPPCPHCGAFYRVGMDGDVWIHSHGVNCAQRRAPASRRAKTGKKARRIGFGDGRG